MKYYSYNYTFHYRFNEHVRPACLYQHPEIDTYKAEVLGWGTTSFAGQTSDELQKASLDIYPNNNCSKFYEQDNDDLPNGIIQTQMCAGDATKKRDAW